MEVRNGTNKCYFSLPIILIGSIGLVYSVLFLLISLNDIFHGEYGHSKNVVFMSGLYCPYDPSPFDKELGIAMICYGSVSLLVNLVLIFTAVSNYRACSYPWLIFQCLDCCLRLGNLMHHLLLDIHHNKTFVYSSIVFIMIISWLWAIILVAQIKLAKEKTIETELHSFPERINTTESVKDLTFTMND